MLGRLLNLASGAAPGTAAPEQQELPPPVSSLESVQEDLHTRNLLFPDVQVLHQHRHDQIFPLTAGPSLSPSPAGGAFDYDGALDLEPRDVRVLVLQDTLGSTAASLLYDSLPPPAYPTSTAQRSAATMAASHIVSADHRRITTPPRKSSLGPASRPLIIQPDNPQTRLSAVDRRASVQGRIQAAETDSQRAWREYREELTTLSGCIFGNSELMAYKGTSTKVHIVPTDVRAGEYSSSLVGDGRGSIGRSSVRSSKLAQSFSSDGVTSSRVANISAQSGRLGDRKKILITRLFPVNIPTDEEVISSPQGRYYEDATSYPFPEPGDEPKFKRKKPQLKQKRTPMYAVALVVNLPSVSAQVSASATTKPVRCRPPGSYTEQDSFSSSFGSARRAGWTMVGPGPGAEPLDIPFGGDLEDRMDIVTQRWDVIMRTLTQLQSVVATTLYAMLKTADLASPDPLPTLVSTHVARRSSVSSRRSDDGIAFKPPKSNAKLLSLLPNSLFDDAQIKAAVSDAQMRVVSGLRAVRVVSGQNRWGIWRDEARWIAKWAAERDQGPFFLNLLTGFLATHTEWLQALSPLAYRRLYLAQQKAKVEEDTAVRARTIIVTTDKMAARRIVFLLSAFLPANQQTPSIRPHRPSTSASFVPFSQSPPAHGVPILNLKEEALRRRINRRTQRASHSRNVSSQEQGPPSRILGTAAPAASIVNSREDSPHGRRPSDAGSIRTVDLPFPGNDAAGRKSSTATTATITSETSTVHFSATYRRESFQSVRPGSSGSGAADDLRRSLARAESMAQASSTSATSRQSSRWGSVISGLLSPRRRESTSTSVASRSSAAPVSPTSKTGQGLDDMRAMVSGADVVQSPTDEELPPDAVENRPGDVPAVTGLGIDGDFGVGKGSDVLPSVHQTTRPASLFQSPVKASVNEDDGVIDVDVPLLDFMTSFESAVSSPSSSGYLSTPGLGGGLDGFEQSCRVSVDGDTPQNVAGWLQRFHPDFVLQATPPQPDLVESVKEALRAEPSPGLSTHPELLAESQVGRWMDVSSAVIADATTFTITRIRYRRLLKPKHLPSNRSSAILSGSFTTHSSVLLTPAISPFEMKVEEDFQVDHISFSDELLTDAVEKIMALSLDDGKDSSTCSSRSVSKAPGRRNSTSTTSEEAEEPHHQHHQPAPDGPQEIPRAQCKAVVLSALEEVARTTADELEGDGRADGADPVGEPVGEYATAAASAAAAESGHESWLRKAARGWLRSVEQVA